MNPAASALARPLAAVLDEAPATWRPLLNQWRATPQGQRLIAHVDARRAAGATIYPAQVLQALHLTPRPAVRVVILGQDPYHGPGQAEGLAFSVPAGVKPPPSLRNIVKELQRDLGLPRPMHGHLSHWARQGVLLLNTTLTVEDGSPGSHARQGWEALTDLLVRTVADDPAPKVFMLWGAHAQARAVAAAGRPQHLVLASNHPSPLSATRPPSPFIGNGHFSAANRHLVAGGGVPIDWSLP